MAENEIGDVDAVVRVWPPEGATHDLERCFDSQEFEAKLGEVRDESSLGRCRCSARRRQAAAADRRSDSIVINTSLQISVTRLTKKESAAGPAGPAKAGASANGEAGL